MTNESTKLAGHVKGGFVVLLLLVVRSESAGEPIVTVTDVIKVFQTLPQQQTPRL